MTRWATFYRVWWQYAIIAAALLAAAVPGRRSQPYGSAQQLVLERFSLDRMVDRCERLLQKAWEDNIPSSAPART